MTNSKVDITDERWSGYCPWFLRHDDFTGSGDFLLFFDRLSHRIKQLLLYNEIGIKNLNHFAHILESKSLRRFQYSSQDTSTISYLQIADYFNPTKIKSEISYKRNLLPIIDRIGVLEILLQALQRENGFFDFTRDVRSYLAEAQIMLDLDRDTYLIKLLEEPLLQREVLDKLLPRLASQFPERAKEFSNAYHDMIDGKKFDDIFIGAFKTLEALAREITKDNSFEFKIGDLQKHFPKLHRTIHDTMIKLSGHQSDESW